MAHYSWMSVTFLLVLGRALLIGGSLFIWKYQGLGGGFCDIQQGEC
jgi:hypothetical protein